MKKRLYAIILSALLCSGCSIVPKGAESSLDFTNSKVIAELVSSDNKSFCANSQNLNLTDEEWTALLSHFGKYGAAEQFLPKESGDNVDLLEFSLNGDKHTLCRITGENGDYIRADGGEYPLTPDADALFEKYCADEKKPDVSQSASDSPEERLIGLSIECAEPTNYDEYLAVSREIVAQWLDSLKDEKGKYRLKSYKFTDDLNENRVFHGDGYVDGGREFVCYVAFDAPEDNGTVFYEAGTYDAFYHYYFGPGVLARFRWENGICTLIDYDEAYAVLTSDSIKSGLYGINRQENKYRTFCDFLNDTDNVNEWLNNGVYHSLYYCRVSHNVMMLANGNVVYCDIGNSDMPIYNGDYATTDMHQYYYNTEGKGLYSSPVDYIDGSGAVVMTYRRGFSLVFDDYNHDGNPDFAIRISSDENGSTYDVRCMDVNGTPWEDSTEIYIPGEFFESVRLQISDSGGFLKPVFDDKGVIRYQEVRFVDKSNTRHYTVSEDGFTDYRMYSQKFFLPETLRSYSSNDSEITCYFWNNTAEAVTVGGEYEIQRLKGDSWEKVLSGKQFSSAEVKAASHAELRFDISDLSDFADKGVAVYRVKINVNGSDVYGGFYYGDSTGADLDITSGQYPTAAKRISFEVKNNGLSAVFPQSISLCRGKEKVCEVDLSEYGSFKSGSTKTVSVSADSVEGGFTAGEYSLVISVNGGEFSGSADIVEIPTEQLYYFPRYVPVKMSGDSIEITLENGVWNKQKAVVTDVSSFRVQKDGEWQTTVYTPDFRGEKEIEYGKSDTVVIENMSLGSRTYFEEIQSGKYDSALAPEYIDRIKNMTFEEYLGETLNAAVPDSGDLCRVEIEFGSTKSEYVYFNFP